MSLVKQHVTKYGTFCDALSAEDIKYFEMTNEAIDERANRLANKALNGIRDKEMVEADERAFRSMELLFGKKVTEKIRKECERVFGY